MNNKLSKRNNVFNFSWEFLQQFVAALYSLVIGLQVARFLGPKLYGMLGYSGAVIIFVSVISGLGIDSILLNELIRKPAKTGSYIGTSLLYRIVISTSVSFLLLVFIIILHPDNKSLFIVIFIQSLSVFFQAYEYFAQWLRMQSEVKWVSITSIASYFIICIVQVLFIIFKMNIYYFAVISVLQNAVNYILLFIVFKYKSGIKLSVNHSDGKKLINIGKHYIVSTLAITIYMQIDKIMIGNMMSDYEVGIYNAAVNISAMWQIIPLAIINVLKPIIMKDYKEKKDGYENSFKYLLFIVTYISFLICIGICIFANIIILLLFGKEYLAAVPSLRITCFSTAVSMIGVVRGVWLLTNDLYKFDKYFTLGTAVINIILNIILINDFGIVGAAISTFISYFIEVFIFPLLFKETRNFDRLFFSSLVHKVFLR